MCQTMESKTQYRIVVKVQLHMFRDKETKCTNQQKALAVTGQRRNQQNSALDNRSERTSLRTTKMRSLMSQVKLTQVYFYEL